MQPDTYSRILSSIENMLEYISSDATIPLQVRKKTRKLMSYISKTNFDISDNHTMTNNEFVKVWDVKHGFHCPRCKNILIVEDETMESQVYICNNCHMKITLEEMM